MSPSEHFLDLFQSLLVLILPFRSEPLVLSPYESLWDQMNWKSSETFFNLFQLIRIPLSPFEPLWAILSRFQPKWVWKSTEHFLKLFKSLLVRRLPRSGIRVCFQFSIFFHCFRNMGILGLFATVSVYRICGFEVVTGYSRLHSLSDNGQRQITASIYACLFDVVKLTATRW